MKGPDFFKILVDSRLKEETYEHYVNPDTREVKNINLNTREVK